MFHLKRAAFRAASQITVSSRISRIANSRVVLPAVSTSSTVRSFTQFRSRLALPPGQEEAATSETTDAIESVDASGEGSAPSTSIGHEQEAAATSETTDQVQRPAAARPGSQLYIGNIVFEMPESELKSLFEPYGQLNKFVLVKKDGVPKGFAFATYATPEEAQAALVALNESSVHGRPLRVRIADPSAKRDRPQQSNRPRTASSPSNSLYIGNLSFSLTDKELNDLFRDIQNVVDVRVAIDRRTGEPRGFAHADFTDDESAAAAIKVLQNKSVGNRPLRVDYASRGGRKAE